jgi:predicted AAA+ superfamily ATPase
MLKRKAYDKLLKWKRRSNGSTAMLVKGARGVGKTTLVEEFGRREYRSCLIIDFSQASTEVRQYFEEYSDDFDVLFLMLSTYYRVELFERDTLVIFDEVQAYPRARGLVKYLVADGRYDYIETGSLISIKQNVRDINIPSEEESMRLEPLDFEEFLWAMGESQLFELIRTYFVQRKPIPDFLHRRAMRLLREYALVGGMPKPVSIYVERRAFAPVDEEKRCILENYRNDVARFAKGCESKVTSILNGIPGQLSKREKKFTLASVGKHARMREYEESFFWLGEAHIANICYAAADPSAWLWRNLDKPAIKVYMADTGLLVTHAFPYSTEAGKEMYRAVLLSDLGINEGMLTENLAAQMLVAAGHSLFYYSQSGRRGDEERMEIDFVVARPFDFAMGKPRVCPIEVKSPKQYGTTSLDRFKKKFGKGIECEVVLHAKQLRVEGDRLYLPLYMAGLL